MTTPTEGADTGMSDGDFDQLVTMIAGNDMGGHSIGSFFRDGETHYVTINDLLSEVSRLRTALSARDGVVTDGEVAAMVNKLIGAVGNPPKVARQFMNEAAALIERQAADLLAVRGERDRMREALERIADKKTLYGSMPEIARRALGDAT